MNIELLTDQQRQEIVLDTLKEMFRDDVSIMFIEKKEYNNPGLPRGVYWVYGFQIQGMTYRLHSATLCLDGFIDIRLHRKDISKHPIVVSQNS